MRKYLSTYVLVPFFDFFFTLDLREVIFVYFIPIVLTVLMYCGVINNSTDKGLTDILGYFINLLAILIGFSITGIAMLASGGSKNLDRLRATNSVNKKIDGKAVDLYKLLLISFIYVVLIEIFTLTLNLLYSFAYPTEFAGKYLIAFYTVDCFLFLHIIFQNIKNVTNLYFSLFNEVKQE